MIADHEAETLLQAWGRHMLDQYDAEVGYPPVSASCAGYEAPDWQAPPPGPVRPGDIERACWVMVVMASRHARLHRDLRDHYRDGCRLGWQRLRTRRRKGAYVEPLGVDQGKALVYSRVKLTIPGAGYVHFPSTPDFDDEYFAQLAAEKLVTRVRGSRPIQEWVQTRPRNEALDCLVGAFAMMRLSGKDLDADPDPERRNPTEKVEAWPPRPVAGVVARHGRGVSRR